MIEYADVERLCKKTVVGNAKRFAKQLGMTEDEALAEARYALFLAMRSYDYNQSGGGLFLYVSRSIRRHFLNAWAHKRAQRRNPTVPVRDGERQRYETVTAPPVMERQGDVWDFEAFLERHSSRASDAPDARLADEEGGDTVRRILEALRGVLRAEDMAILECRVDPPQELRMLMCDEMAEEPTIVMIGKHLGLSKNSVDWSLKRIRRQAKRLIAREFSELTESSLYPN